MNVIGKIVKSLFGSFMHQTGLHLKKEVDQNLILLKADLIKSSSVLSNGILSAQVINMLQTLLKKSWETILTKNTGKLGFLKNIVINIVSPFVNKEIDSLNIYQNVLETLLNSQINENKIDKLIEWIESHIDAIIDKIFN